ncbi:MAG: DNA repair protein RecN [Cytophagaceae bacterium]|nr:DNA repair protein RecN [Cytophagaceae bacterium]
MLKSLSIKNYALIRQLDIEPSGHLNIVTGETGAGKSIMLGAIGLLLGHRADTKVLFDQNEKCIIEGNFNIAEYKLQKLFEEAELDYDESCIIRREISPQNKSRAFVNDTPVNLDLLKKLGSRLMDVHSQHETLLLGDVDFQIGIVDAFAGNEKILNTYRQLYQEHKLQSQKYEEMVAMADEAKKQLDYNTFQLTELSEASLQAGEQEKLEEDLKRLENAEDIKLKLNQALTIFSNSDSAVLPNLQSIQKLMDFLGPFSSDLNSLKERLRTVLIELKDIAAEIENEESKVEAGGENLEKTQGRLSKIYQLQKKHRVNKIEELLAIEEELSTKVSQVLNLDQEIEALGKKVEALKKQMMTEAESLSKTRKAIIEKIASELKGLLKDVGIPDASILVQMEKTEANKTGIDKINILFSANKGIAPQELKNAASGGEFSRLMLCIKYILASKTSLPTIVFDEIDTGISGEVAIKVGKMMKHMSKRHQVVAISHLPQIAAQGDTHYFVYKDNSSTRAISKIKKLSEDERIKEIAQMIGGEKPSDTAIRNAKELLSIR